MDYLERVSSTTSPIVVEFIGGEPLLNEEAILQFNRLMNERGLEYTAIMSTNGTFPLKEVLSQIPRIAISTCLSMPDDCAAMRYARGRDTSSVIVSNLRDLRIERGQEISVRYNAHSGNLDEFPRFLDWLGEQGLDFIARIEVERIVAKHIPGFSEVPPLEFEQWRSGPALEALLNRGWPPPSRFVDPVGPCRAHTPWSCKVRADGSVVPCTFFCAPSSSEQMPKLNIEELALDPSLLATRFSLVKVDPKSHASCRVCDDSHCCPGKIACFGFECPPVAERRSHDAILVGLLERHTDVLPLLIRNLA